MTSTQALYLIANNCSGAGRARDVVASARTLCDQLRLELHIRVVERPKQLNAVLREVRNLASDSGARVIVVGGDGTLRTAAQILVGTSIPLAVVPTGTFNFFARNLGIPDSPVAALELAVQGEARPVMLGEVNGRVFLNNASFGMYSRLIRAREAYTRRFGRHRVVAALSTLLTLMKGYRTMRLNLRTSDATRQVLSRMVFVGINTLQLRGVSVEYAQCTQRQQMTVVVMKPLQRWDMFRLIFRGLLRRLSNEENLACFCAERLTIEPDRRHLGVVLDGERLRLQSPLNFGICRDVLHVVQPATEVEGGGQ